MTDNDDSTARNFQDSKAEIVPISKIKSNSVRYALLRTNCPVITELATFQCLLTR